MDGILFVGSLSIIWYNRAAVTNLAIRHECLHLNNGHISLIIQRQDFDGLVSTSTTQLVILHRPIGDHPGNSTAANSQLSGVIVFALILHDERRTF